MADHEREYREAVDRVNRATDSEIAEAMAEILKQQRERPRLKPAGRRDG